MQPQLNGRSATQTVLSIYRCPSDPAPDLNSFRLGTQLPTGGVQADANGPFALSNYRAICGTDSSDSGFKLGSARNSEACPWMTVRRL